MTAKDQLDKRVKAFSAQFESALVTAMISMDLATIQSITEQATELPDIIEFTVTLDDKVAAQSINNKNSLVEKKSFHNVIQAGGQKVGEINYTLSLEGISKNKEYVFRTLLSLCLGELFVATLLALWIAQYIGKRSDYLLDGIYRYTAGQSLFEEESLKEDEFGQIAKSFNVMAKKIMESSKSLENLRLQNSNNAKMASLGEMASSIAHEINNPLTVIVSKSDLLCRRIQGDQFEKAHFESELGKIQQTAKRITKIINGLRTFSRNADNDPLEPVPINQLIDDTLNLCTERFKTHSIELNLKINLDPEVLQRSLVLGRPTQISQVLLNLLNNSFDAVLAYDQKWVELKAEIKEKLLVLSVTDSGTGIPPHIVDKLMDPFFTTKEVGKGTGLGLSISKGIIEGHKGRFYYDDTSAHTCFVIELPLRDHSR